MIPAVTMRTFSEEKKSGTLELLLTKPVSNLGLIIGKYLSGFTLVLLALIPTLIYYYSIYLLGNPLGNIDSAGVFGSYIGLALLGAVFTSVGIFSSSITENQIIAFIVGVFFCFFFYQGFSSISTLAIFGNNSLLIDQFGILYHYTAMSKGLIDSRNLIYFFSMIAFMLASTSLVLSSKKW